jgi:5-hydroxyisourate hydrolase-like protein (transthyretin family)
MLILLSSVVFAGGIEDPKASSNMAMMKKGNSHVQIFYKGNKSAKVQIAIYDAEKKLKFSEVVRNTDGFSRPYDLSKLAAGEYTIEMNDGVNTIVERVDTKEIKSSFVSQVVKIQGKENKYLVTVADKNASSLIIRIESPEGNVLFEHADVMSRQYAKVFALPDSCNNCSFIVKNDKGEVLSMKK